MRSRPISPAMLRARLDLLGPPLRHADVQHLAGAHEVVEGAQRLLERRLVVEAVRLVEVDVVGLQPLQRRVAALHDVLARQAAVVLARAGRPVHLGEDLEALAPGALERLAEDRLGLGLRVHVSGVERRDADVERLVHARGGLLGLHLRAVRQPVAVADLARPSDRCARGAGTPCPERTYWYDTSSGRGVIARTSAASWSGTSSSRKSL